MPDERDKAPPLARGAPTERRRGRRPRAAGPGAGAARPCADAAGLGLDAAASADARAAARGPGPRPQTPAAPQRDGAPIRDVTRQPLPSQPGAIVAPAPLDDATRRPTGPATPTPGPAPLL